MTLPTEQSSQSYPGNDVTTSFPVPYRVQDRSHLRVFTTNALGAETELVENTDYTLTNTTAYLGWNVNLIEPVINYGAPKPLATGLTLTIERVPPFIQGTDLRNASAISGEGLENALDYLTMLAQRLKTNADALATRITNSVTQVWQQARLMGSTSGHTDLTTDAVAGSGSVKFPATTGLEEVAYKSWVSDEMVPGSPRSVNLWNWMTPSERTALVAKTIPDLTAAIQAAINECPIGYEIIFPSGPFKTTSTVTLGKGVSLRGSGTYGSESSYNDHSQWTIPNSGIAIQIDPSYVSGAVDPISQYAGGAFMGRISGVKFQGIAAANIAARMLLDQIAINVRDGWEYEIDHCDFRNVGTCFAANGAWAVRIHNNLFVDNGYVFREDPDFALAGYRFEAGTGGLHLYQVNNIVFRENSIITSGYGLYLHGPYHNVVIENNVIQGCTQRGILASRFVGALATAGTDLSNNADGLVVRGNYFEANGSDIQLGQDVASIGTSGPKGVTIEDNYSSFQGSTVYCLRVYSAYDTTFNGKMIEPYASSNNDIWFASNCVTARSKFEARNGWAGHLNGDATSVVRKIDNTYRAAWSSLHVDPSSGSKIGVSALWTMNAGTAALPFDSLATLSLWLRRVLRAERAFQGISAAPNLLITLHAGAYAENLSFDGATEDVQHFDLVVDAAASADSVEFTGISINFPYVVQVAGGGKIVFNVNPETINPNVIRLGGVLKLDTVKLRYASAGAASTKGFFVYDGGTLLLKDVTNYDSNKPYYGLYATSGSIFKNGSVPTGSNANEVANGGGFIRGDVTNEPNGTQFTTFYGGSKGANVASSGAITPTGMVFHVTGTTTVYTMNLPYTGFFGSLTIIPDGAFAIQTGGNFNAAATPVVGKPMVCTWDGSKWFTSY